MKTLYIIIILSLALVGIERMTLPLTSPEMIATAHTYGETNEKQTPPKEFVHDGCTLLPDKLPWNDFTQACFDHDVAYWYGGTKEERNNADKNLKQAVAESGTIGYILQWPIYLLVHLFGDTWLTKLFDANWGFGWNK